MKLASVERQNFQGIAWLAVGSVPMIAVGATNTIGPASCT